MFNLTTAKRSKSKLRLGISGSAGSGKTYSALKIAYGLTKDWTKIAVIDTERGSADLYSDFGEYLTGQINAPFTPQKYIDAIHQCEQAGIEVIIIDSLSHCWNAEGGLLDEQNNIAKKSGNSYTAWRDITPLHNKLVDTILTSTCHVIATLRSKTEYVLETNNKGKQVPKKVGMTPIFRQGIDYEFTVCLELDNEHHAVATKDRTKLFTGVDFIPDENIGIQLKEWLESGADIPKCADCGKEIEAYGSNSAIQVSLASERKYGRKLCVQCAMKAKEITYEEKIKGEPVEDFLGGDDNAKV